MEASKSWLQDIIEFGDELSSQEMWDCLHDVSLSKAKDMLGVSKGSHFIDKETWWCNEDTKKRR